MIAEPTFPTPALHQQGAQMPGHYLGRLCTLAEAWAWRCADTMPDSAQSRLDSEADAEALVVYAADAEDHAGQHCSLNLSNASSFTADALRYGLAPDMALGCRTQRGTVAKRTRGLRENARTAASAAFRACPGLRG